MNLAQKKLNCLVLGYPCHHHGTVRQFWRKSDGLDGGNDVSAPQPDIKRIRTTGACVPVGSMTPPTMHALFLALCQNQHSPGTLAVLLKGKNSGNYSWCSCLWITSANGRWAIRCSCRWKPRGHAGGNGHCRTLELWSHGTDVQKGKHRARTQPLRVPRGNGSQNFRKTNPDGVYSQQNEGWYGETNVDAHRNAV